MAAYARFMTHVTCRLTAKNRDQLRNPMLGNRVWATITLFRDIVVLYEISLTAEWLCETALVFFLYWFSF